jgi:hypothetical protein
MRDCFKGLIVGLVAAVLAVPVLGQTQLEMTTQAARDFTDRPSGGPVEMHGRQSFLCILTGRWHLPRSVAHAG